MSPLEPAETAAISIRSAKGSPVAAPSASRTHRDCPSVREACVAAASAQAPIGTAARIAGPRRSLCWSNRPVEMTSASSIWTT